MSGPPDSPHRRCHRCGRGSAHALSRCGWCGALARPARCGAHPETLTSRGCAVCGRAVCAACDHGDRYVSLCGRHADVNIVQGWAEAFRTSDDAEAELAAGSVRAAGLDAHVLSQKDHAHMLSMAGMAIVRVLVPAVQYEAARDVLGAVDEADGAESA